MIRTATEARALLRRTGAIALTPAEGLHSLVTEIAGPVRGSWWNHPKGKEIFSIAEALADAPGVLVAKLAGGRVTFVDRALWPALYRVVSDEAWRGEAALGLDAAARRLLAEVERRGELRLDELGAELPPAERRALSRARGELERRALVRSVSEHTEGGRHALRLTAWSCWASAEIRRKSSRLSIGSAIARLARSGIRLGAGGKGGRPQAPPRRSRPPVNPGTGSPRGGSASSARASSRARRGG